VEYEQGGEKRAGYGKQTLKRLSEKLTQKFGRGFSVQNLDRMRFFFVSWSKSSTVSRKSNFPLSWSHYTRLLTLKNEQERRFYEVEAEQNNWSVRTLDGQIESSLYERVALSRDKKEVLKTSIKNITALVNPKIFLNNLWFWSF